MKLNYEEIGLKVGLEIHLQLSTKHKLFCRCNPVLAENFKNDFIRRLRPTQSELYQIDPAALFEFQKGKFYKYLVPTKSTCLVEMDEEPPHPLNLEALKVALKVAKALKSDIVDEVQVMRKIVIDGSNTTGFQRTCLIALNGEITVNGKKIPIQTICLEEDAARLIEKDEEKSIFALDRLGIPLIEIATAPAINSPEEAVKVALEIGRLAKATGYVRNELGVIRQDVNISIMGGKVAEVKGVQRLSQLKKVVEFEAQRQYSLTKIAEELKNRGISESDLRVEPVDVTNVFSGTKCRLIKQLISQGKRVYAVKLKGFSGLLGLETAPNYRLGKEVTERVRFWTRVKGLFHTDELPNYGISMEEVEELRKAVQAEELDAVVFLIGSKEEAKKGLEKVIERAIEALYGPPYETRGSKEDGTTFYMRPRPGMARMYPETDIPPIQITADLISEIEREPLTHPRTRVKELMALGLSEQLSWEIYDSRYFNLFIDLVSKLRKIKPSFIASTLTETIKSLERDGFNVEVISEKKLFEVFKAVDDGLTAKESIVEILKELTRTPFESVESVIDRLNLRAMSETELREIVDKVVEENFELIREIGEKAFKKVVGRVMSIVRGKADPKKVVDLVRRKINEATSSKL